MIGSNAARHPQLVARVAELGHAIGNHSWDHSLFTAIEGRERRSQIRRCARAIRPHGVRLFRPPGGHQSLASRVDALLLGYDVVTWDVMAGDWIDESYEADRISANLQEAIRPGSIVLLHDGLWDPETARVADRGPVVEAVDSLLRALEGRYDFVTLPELLERGRATRRYSVSRATSPGTVD